MSEIPSFFFNHNTVVSTINLTLFSRRVLQGGAWCQPGPEDEISGRGWVWAVVARDAIRPVPTWSGEWQSHQPQKPLIPSELTVVQCCHCVYGSPLCLAALTPFISEVLGFRSLAIM